MDSYPSTNLLSQEILYQHLQRVSRSFALTIPFMEEPLRDQIALAYIMCRMVDTVEDDSSADIDDKITWLSDFAFLSSGEFEDSEVLMKLKERAIELSSHGSAKFDLELLHDMDRAVNLLLSYDDEVKDLICHAISIMSHGMASSLRRSKEHEEIQNIDDVDNYCYFVAGVVGEMLAELFALHDKKVDKKQLLELSVSFGEALQLTNILRDRAKDLERGVSFLPKNDVQSVLDYVAITQGHLDDAITFISKLCPHKSKGVRLFCIVNVAMAVCILKKIAKNPVDPQCNYKISRRKMKFLFVFCEIAAKSNFALKSLMFMLSLGMKRNRRNARQLRDKVSLWDHSSTTN